MRHLFDCPLCASPFNRGAPKNIAPVIAAAGLTAGANLVGGAINNIVNRSNMRYQADVAKDLAQYQWDNFTSYPAQVKSMLKAGLNPSAILGQGGSGTVSGPSINMPTSQPVDFGLSMNSIADAVQTIALAKKTNQEGVAKQLQNKLMMETFADQVKQVGLKNKWTEAEITKMDKEVEKIAGELGVMHWTSQLEEKKVNWFDRHMSAEIDDLKQSAAYKRAEAGLSASNKKLLDDTMESLKRLANYNADYLQKTVGLLDKYGDAQAIVGMISQVLGFASDFIGNFIPSKKVMEIIKK